MYTVYVKYNTSMDLKVVVGHFCTFLQKITTTTTFKLLNRDARGKNVRRRLHRDLQHCKTDSGVTVTNRSIPSKFPFGHLWV